MIGNCGGTAVRYAEQKDCSPRKQFPPAETGPNYRFIVHGGCPWRRNRTRLQVNSFDVFGVTKDSERQGNIGAIALPAIQNKDKRPIGTRQLQ
jgi:hypothetical protein